MLWARPGVERRPCACAHSSGGGRVESDVGQDHAVSPRTMCPRVCRSQNTRRTEARPRPGSPIARVAAELWFLSTSRIPTNPTPPPCPSARARASRPRTTRPGAGRGCRRSTSPRLPHPICGVRLVEHRSASSLRSDRTRLSAPAGPRPAAEIRQPVGGGTATTPEPRRAEVLGSFSTWRLDQQQVQSTGSRCLSGTGHNRLTGLLGEPVRTTLAIPQPLCDVPLAPAWRAVAQPSVTHVAGVVDHWSPRARSET